MERELTSNEINKINQICELEIGLATKYCNFAKIIAPIFTISIFLFLYFEIAWGPIWIYLGVGVLIAIIEIIAITNIQTPCLAINDNNCLCFESKMISSRIVSSLTSQKLTAHFYYIRINVNGEVKEVEYRGKEFDYLSIGEPMLIIQYENKKKEKEYICFSKKEINGKY